MYLGCLPADPAARTFLQQLLQELSKVSAFYVEKAGALEVRDNAQGSRLPRKAAAAAGQISPHESFCSLVQVISAAVAALTSTVCAASRAESQAINILSKSALDEYMGCPIWCDIAGNAYSYFSSVPDC